ncbi:MAG: SDR family oxidoreductase [Actinobacteria bacterium]|nr:SDR family oxidoreductase [Actinomycetota bacterium]MBM3712040.1 SDR family oxidoreductase [Actinomycetota bacterium]
MGETFNKRLKEKIVIVTGGTQGLGESIARYLAELEVGGLVICGRNQKKGESIARDIEKRDIPTFYVKANLAIEEECRNVVKVCDKKFGRVDGLVNAAGDTSRGTLEDTTIELWDYIFAINTRAPFILIQESAKIMKREGRGGSIVNIISIASYGGLPTIVAYSTSKGAMVTLTKNIAHALKFDHIRVNGLNIGWTYTEAEDRMQKSEGKPDDWLELAEAEMPFGRLIFPLDVARLTAFLISDDSEMMTGAIIDFDQNVIGVLGDYP